MNDGTFVLELSNLIENDKENSGWFEL
jgi:hypothetical protein